MSALVACVDSTGSRVHDGTESPVLAVREAASGRVTLRILGDGEGTRRYLLGTSTDTLRYPELVARLEALPGGVPGDSTLFVYTYAEARGYDVVRAMHAAEAAGFRAVRGVADYSNDESMLARMQWKEWEQPLNPDSSRHARRADSMVRTSALCGTVQCQ
jgi:hypothetical protein